jgi:hypothetical protein
MAALNASRAEVRVWIHPIDPEATFRSPCALNVAFSSLFSPDNGDSAGTSTSSGGGGFSPLEWQGQTAIQDVRGPLQFVRFLKDGRVEFGARNATEAKPEKEICGLTVRPKRTRMHCSIDDSAGPSGSAGASGGAQTDRRPGLPAKEPVLEWVTEQGGDWEREIPARLPLHGGLRHRSAAANRTVKAKTKEKWGENEALSFVLDLNGVAYQHKGEPALRLEFGGRYSVVLRGIGKDVRPVLERRGSDSQGTVAWRVWRTLSAGPALDDTFWYSRHEVSLFRLSGLLVVTWNGTSFWVGEEVEGEMRPVGWKASPLRLSVVGCDVLLQVFRTDFSEKASFSSRTGVESPPSHPVDLRIRGAEVHQVGVENSTARALLHGADLEDVEIDARWEADGVQGLVKYNVRLSGTVETPPLLCSLWAQFPPTAATATPEPIDFRIALDALEVESGDPETLPSAEARFVVSYSQVEQFIPKWRSALLPFRPVHIEVDSKMDGNFQTIFWGYLLPEGISSDGYRQEKLSLVARDPKVRLREPAALVDGRFAPLDLMPDAAGQDLYGAQCVQKLIGLELGQEWAETFNGSGNPFAYYEDDHFPLLSGSGDSYYLTTQMPETGGARLPPPMGEDVERWINKIAASDYATWFFDPREGERGAWVYGDITSFFAVREQVVHELHDTTGGFTGDSLTDWPLLSRYNAQGLLEKAYTRIRVWGAAPEGTTSPFFPSLFVGAAGAAPDPTSADPLSENQSWPRTLLLRHEFIGQTTSPDFADSLAWRVWSEFGGRAPEKFDFTLDDQILPARWGEKLNFGPYQLRIVRTKHRFSFTGDGARVTEITARSLSATGL